MKRDVDLIRQLLFYVEERFDPSKGALDFSQEQVPDSLLHKHTPAEVLRHVELLWEAGLVDVCSSGSRENIQRTENGIATSISICGLTHEGHEFIGNIREDETWKQTKEKAESVALDVLKDTAKGIVMGSIGL